VPHRLASPKTTNRYAVLYHVGHHVDLRISFHEAPSVLLDRRPVELTKPAAAGDQVLVSQRLPAEEQHQMFQPGAMNGREITRTEATQIDPADLRTKRASHRCYRDRHPASPPCLANLAAARM